MVRNCCKKIKIVIYRYQWKIISFLPWFLPSSRFFWNEMTSVFASHTKHWWLWNDLNFLFNQTGRSLRSGRFASNLVNLIVQVKSSCHGSKSLMRTRGRKIVLRKRILRAVLEIKISTSVHKLLEILKPTVFLGFTCLCLLECLQFLEFVTVEQSLRLIWNCVQLWSDFSVTGMPAIYH